MGQNLEINVNANVKGQESVEDLTTRLDDMAKVLDGDLKAQALAAAAELRKLSEQQAAIAAFAELNKQTQKTAAELNRAQAEAKAFGDQIGRNGPATLQEAQALGVMTARVDAASAKLQEQQQALSAGQAKLQTYGIAASQTAAAQQRLQAETAAVRQKVSELNPAYQGASGAATAAGATMQRSHRAMADGMESISTQLQRVQSAYLALQGGGELGSLIKSALATADAYNNLESRIKLATSGNTDFAGTMKDVADISLRTHSSLETTGDLFGKLTMSGKSAGLSAKDAQMQALALTETINQAVQLSGASAQASDAAITQLVQGLNGGALRGDEFNSVMEQSPRLAKAMADGLGVTTGELRKMAEAGALTADTVIRALRSQSDTLKTEFSSLPPTVGRAVQDLSTAWMLYVGETDKATGASVTAAQAIGLLSANLKTVAGFLIDAGQAAAGFVALRLAQQFLGIGAAATTSAAAVTANAAATTAAGAAAATTTVQLGRMAAMLATLRTFTLIGIVTNFKDIGTWIGESIAKLQGYKDKSAELVAQEELHRKKMQEQYTLQQLRNDGIRQAQDAQLGLTKATTATVDKFDALVKGGKSAADAIKDIGKDFDLSKAPGIRDAGMVLNALVAKGKLTSTEFQQAWADALKGEDLGLFASKAKLAFLSTGQDAEVAAKITEQVQREALKRVEGGYELLAGKVSNTSKRAINDTQVIIDGLGNLSKMGVDTGAALQASIGKGIDTANTQKALDAVKAQIEQVRKVLGDKIADGLLDQAKEKSIGLKDALDKVTPGVNSLSEALKGLGVASDANLKKAAAEALKLYEAVKANGGSVRETTAAFESYATKAIAANGGVATEALKVQAAMNGVAIASDEAGNTTARAMGKAAVEASAAAAKIVAAQQEQARAWIESVVAAQKASEEQSRKAEADKAEKEAAIEAAFANRQLTLSYEELAKSVGYAGASTELFGRIYAEELQPKQDAFLDSLKGVTTIGFERFKELGRIYDLSAQAAKSAALEYDSLTAAIERQNSVNSSAQKGVDDLRLRLLEIEGTERQIAEAKAERERSDIERQIKVAELEARRASVAKDDKAVAQYRADAADLKAQLELLDKIDQAETRRAQKQAADAAKAQQEKQAADRQQVLRQAAETAKAQQQSAAKVYDVRINGQTYSASSDAAAQELIKLLQTSRLAS